MKGKKKVGEGKEEGKEKRKNFVKNNRKIEGRGKRKKNYC